MGDYNNAVNTETGSPEKNLLRQRAPAEQVAGEGVSRRVREELIIAHSGELRAKKGSHGPSCLKLTNYK